MKKNEKIEDYCGKWINEKEGIKLEIYRNGQFLFEKIYELTQIMVQHYDYDDFADLIIIHENDLRDRCALKIENGSLWVVGFSKRGDGNFSIGNYWGMKKL